MMDTIIRQLFCRIVLATGGVLLPALAVPAAVIDVPATDGALLAAVSQAQPGDTLRLEAGVHIGPIMLNKTLTIEGVPGAIIDGGSKARVIEVNGANSIIRGLTIRDSGRSLATEDAGIYLTKTAHGSLIENNTVRSSLIGIYLKGSNDTIVRGNKIFGLTDLRVNERGNGIQIWNSPGAIIENNEIRDGRDGIFVTTSKRNIFKRNFFERTRIAVHYMYTNDSEVSGNVSKGNHVGYALMYSKKLNVRDNASDGDRDHGILLNYTNRSVLERNTVRDGKTKCVFIYNSSKNVFHRNLFKGCGIGIHFTAGSERNQFTENAFIANRHQVKYVGSRWLDWSKNGRGNYWSDNTAFDLNGDGLADTPYKPNDMIDGILWAYPTAKLLLNSPAVRTLRWAQRQFPALYPGGVIDSAPLMRPPKLAAVEQTQ